MLGLPGGFARNFKHVGWGGVGWGCVNVGVHVYTSYAAGVLMCTHGTWGGVGWGVSTLVFMCTHGTLLVCLMCTHGTLLVCWCVHMVRCWCVHVYTSYAAGVLMCTHGTWGGVGWGVSTLVFMCTHGTLLVRWCVHMVRCWCVDVYTWCAAGVFMCTHGTLLVCWCVHMVRGVGWGGVGCVNVGVHVYTWYAAGVLMCTHGTLLVCWCVHMVRCWCVHAYTWCAAGVLMCTHGTWGGVGWGGVCQRWCSCVHMVRCWCVDVYTWYAAGVLMCTHGTLLVCSCVHMVRCWCVHVYTWYAAGVFMCAHGTLLVCHVQTYHAIAVSCLIVHRFLILIGFNVFLLAMCLLSVWLFLFTSGVCDIYIYMYVYFMSVYICMQIVSNGNAVNYRWLLIFPPDLAKKTQVWTLSKHSMINCIWQKYEVYLWTTTFYMKKHSKINTMTTRTTNGCGYSSHVVTVDLVPSRANPPGGANMLQSLFHKTIQETPLVDGNMWLPPRLPALSLRNAQLVFSRRQLNMGHPSRLGLGTSCDQLKDGAHFGHWHPKWWIFPHRMTIIPCHFYEHMITTSQPSHYECCGLGKTTPNGFI